MTVLEVQPTPNPHAIKIIVEEQITPRPLSFFNAEAGKSHPLASQLFAIQGVTSLLILNDFITINKLPEVAWKAITSKAKQVLAAWNE